MSKNRYASKGIDNSKQTFYHFEKGGNKQDPQITFPLQISFIVAVCHLVEQYNLFSSSWCVSQ